MSSSVHPQHICLNAPATVHVAVDPRVKLVAYIACMWSGIRASHTSYTTSSCSLYTDMARGVGPMVLVRVDPGVQFVCKIASMMSRIARASHAARIGAMISIRVETWVELVAHVA